MIHWQQGRTSLPLQSLFPHSVPPLWWILCFLSHPAPPGWILWFHSLNLPPWHSTSYICLCHPSSLFVWIFDWAIATIMCSAIQPYQSQTTWLQGNGPSLFEWIAFCTQAGPRRLPPMEISYPHASFYWLCMLYACLSGHYCTVSPFFPTPSHSYSFDLLLWIPFFSVPDGILLSLGFVIL